MLTDPRRRTIIVLWLGTWAAFLCVGIPLAVLPRYVHDELHLGDAAAGFAVGSLSLAAMLMRPFGGRLADERSRRLVVGGGLAALHDRRGGADGLVGLRDDDRGADDRRAGESWGVRRRDGVGARSHREGSARIGRSRCSGWRSGSGAAAGTAIGEGLHAWTGDYRTVWATVAVIPFTGLLLLGFAAPEAARPTRRGPRPPLILRVAVRPGLGLALANLGYGAVASLVTLHLADRGVGSPGLTLTAVAAAVVVARLAVARALDRTGPWGVLALGCASQAVGLLLIAVAHGLPTAIAGGLLLGAGYAAVFPALALMVVEAAPDDQRGAALGGFTAFLDFGLAIAGPLAGATATLLGRPQAFLGAAALTLLALSIVPRGGRVLPGVPHVPAESERL
ncbi:MAG: MFS transporter [Patulibacter minatonensis]